MAPHVSERRRFLRSISIDVATATGKPTGRSSSSGKDTMLTASAASAKPAPTNVPAIVITQPIGVVSAAVNRASALSGISGPSVST